MASPNMTEGMVAATILIHPTKPPGCMWRRPLNSAVLAAPTHKGLGKVSDGTSTQVVT